MEQNTGLQRNKQEKYYTKKAVVLSCLQIIKENISIHPKDVIIEPSAGNGSFSIPLTTLYNNVIAYDLYPEHKDIIQQDYLSLLTERQRISPSSSDHSVSPKVFKLSFQTKHTTIWSIRLWDYVPQTGLFTTPYSALN